MTLQERAHGIFVDLTVVPVGLGVVADDEPYENHFRAAQQEVEYAVATILKGLQAGVAEEREACAKILDAIVREHRVRQLGEEHEDVTDGVRRGHVDTTSREPHGPRCGEPGYFCEDYGCGSLEDIAAAIRARGGPR